MDEIETIRRGWKVVFELCANSQEVILSIDYNPATRDITARTESGTITINIDQS